MYHFMCVNMKFLFVHTLYGKKFHFLLFCLISHLLSCLQLEGQFRTVEGRPGEAIVHVARTANVKLIVIGSRGSSKLRRTLLGSITDYVLNHAHVAVLVCRNKRHLLDHVLRKQASTEDGLRKRSLKDRLLRKYHSMDEPRAKDSSKKRERQSSQTDST